MLHGAEESKVFRMTCRVCGPECAKRRGPRRLPSVEDQTALPPRRRPFAHRRPRIISSRINEQSRIAAGRRLYSPNFAGRTFPAERASEKLYARAIRLSMDPGSRKVDLSPRTSELGIHSARVSTTGKLGARLLQSLTAPSGMLPIQAVHHHLRGIRVNRRQRFGRSWNHLQELSTRSLYRWSSH